MSLYSLALRFGRIQGVIYSKPCFEAISAIQCRDYAARKGTRERKLKKKVKVEIQKVGFIPHKQRNLEKFLAQRPKRKFDDSWRRLPIDDVYIAKYYRWKVYPFSEALECHRETHHPEMFDKPDADLIVSIELNMQGEKKTRFVDDFTRIVAVPHPFEHGEERTVIAFSKDVNIQKVATEAGAHLSGGAELIKQIQNGEISMQDFQFVVAHPDILPELVQLRGLLKKRFPNPKNGTLDIDVPTMIKRFMNGIRYKAVKDEYEKDFGVIDAVIGKLNMDATHLEKNFCCLLKDVNEMKPKREGEFITRCLLVSPPSRERFKIDVLKYIETENEEQEEDEEKEEAVTL